MAKLETIDVPLTKAVLAVAKVLEQEGYLTSIKVDGKTMLLTLKYGGGRPAMMGIKRMSKPGSRFYSGFKDLPRVWGGLGMHILSTPKGVISSKEAKKLGVGGEVIAQVW